MRRISKLVQDPEWQSLRRSFLGTWKTKADGNVERLLDYLGDFSDRDKVDRVHNYLTGSFFRSGFTTKRIDRLLFKIRKGKSCRE